MSGDNTGDSSFAALPRRIRQRIDQAFDSAAKENNSSLEERKEIAGGDSKGYQLTRSITEPQMGGFILDDRRNDVFNDQCEGGFIPDEASGGFIADTNMRKKGQDYSTDDDIADISLAAIPTALQILDLPPDDEQVLAVFKNAASGWTRSRSTGCSIDALDATDVVSRKDWRAVCAVLMAPQQQSDEEADDSDEVMDSGEEYVGSDEDEHGSISGENDLEDGDYLETPVKTKSRRIRERSRKVPDEEIRAITARQKEASREAFALFFPDIAKSQLDLQRITISDLVRVSKELKEKLTFDQMMEMLSTISNSTDKSSVSLSDFEKMLVQARMV